MYPAWAGIVRSAGACGGAAPAGDRPARGAWRHARRERPAVARGNRPHRHPRGCAGPGRSMVSRSGLDVPAVRSLGARPDLPRPGAAGIAGDWRHGESRARSEGGADQPGGRPRGLAGYCQVNARSRNSDTICRIPRYSGPQYLGGR